MAQEVIITLGAEQESKLGTATSEVNKKGRITFTEKSICLGLGDSYIDYTDEFADFLGFVKALPAITADTTEKTFAYNEIEQKLYVTVINETTQALEWKELKLGSATSGTTGGFDSAQNTAPTNPKPNEIWLDTSTGMIYIYKEVLNDDGTGTGTYQWTLPKDTTGNVVPETEQFVTRSEFLEALTIKNFDTLISQP